MTEEPGWRRIRPVALGVPTRSDGDELLLAEHRDPAAGEAFYRPLGGGVEFGEQSADAVVRELGEELDVTVTETRHLATLERTFEFNGQDCHEIGFVYAVDLAEDWAYEGESFVGREPELGEEFDVAWVSRDELGRDDVTVYPEELLELVS